MTNLLLKFSFNATVHLEIVKNDDCKNKYLDRILVITLRLLLPQHLIIQECEFNKKLPDI